MLDFFRSHKRLMQVLLALFILPGLGLVGIQGARHASGAGPDVASINGNKITYREYSIVLQERLQQIRSMLGGGFDVQAINTPAFQHAVLESLIEQRLIAEEAKKQHLSVPDDTVRRALLSVPAIAKLRGPDGSIDVKAYGELLAAQGMTPEDLDERVRTILAAGQLTQSIVETAFLPQALVTPFLIASGQQREVQAMHFVPADPKDPKNTPPSQADLKAYYESHAEDFVQPEQALIEYITLSPDAFTPSEPSLADLEKYYQAHIADYKNEERVRARHILLIPAQNQAEDEPAVRARLEALLAQLRAHPEQFVTLAKKYSQDPGSATKGGDLGYFGRRQMDPAFEAAAFSLKPGEISEVVQSQFGYHLIQLIDRKPAVTLAFSEVKARIAAILKKQEAARRFSEASSEFSDLLYEQSTSLVPAAEKFHLTRKTATVARTPNLGLAAENALNQTALLNAVFSEEVLKSKHNTAALDLGNNTLIAARVLRYTPRTQKPLNKVERQVRTKVMAVQAGERARAAGQAKLAALQAMSTSAHAVPSGFSAPITVSRANTGALPAPALAAIFKANAASAAIPSEEKKVDAAPALEPEKVQKRGMGLPQYIGVDLGHAGYVIYRLNAVHDPVISKAIMDSAQQQLAQITGQSEFNAYIAAVRARTKVKIYPLPTQQ